MKNPFASIKESRIGRALVEAIKSRKYARGLGWLLVALLGALLLDTHPAVVDTFVGRWFGACLKVATGGFGGYRFSRDICRIDPSEALPGVERGLLHLARAILIGACVIGVCVSI